jgi:predicted Zn-dependent peptidase
MRHPIDTTLFHEKAITCATLAQNYYLENLFSSHYGFPVGVRYGKDLSVESTWLWLQGLAHHTSHFLQFFQEILLERNLNQETFTAYRQRGLERTQHRSLFEKMRDDLRKEIFAGTVFALSSQASRDCLSTLTLQDVEEFCTTTYRPRGSALIVVGNMQRDVILDDIATRFAGWQGTAIAQHSWGKPLLPQTSCIAYQIPSVSQQIIVAIPLSTIECCEFPSIQILAHILGGNRSSRLYTAIRERRGLAYDISAQIEGPQYLPNHAVLLIKVVTQPTNTHEVLRIILDELSQLQMCSISDEEFKLAKIQIYSEAIMREDQMLGLFRGITERWWFQRRCCFIREFLQELAETTIDDMQRLLSHFSLCEHRVIRMIGPIKEDELKCVIPSC